METFLGGDGPGTRHGAHDVYEELDKRRAGGMSREDAPFQEAPGGYDLHRGVSSARIRWMSWRLESDERGRGQMLRCAVEFF